MIKLFAYFTNVNACCVARQLPPTFQKISITVRNKGKFETDYPVTLIVTLPWWRKTKTSRELYPLWIHCFTKVFPLWVILQLPLLEPKRQNIICALSSFVMPSMKYLKQVYLKKKQKKTNIATRETKVEKPNYFAIFPRTQFVKSSQLVQINIALGAHT